VAAEAIMADRRRRHCERSEAIQKRLFAPDGFAFGSQ
jgi:hypothetical protein